MEAPPAPKRRQLKAAKPAFTDRRRLTVPDPYAQVTTMCRFESSSHKSSWSDGSEGVATSLHSFRHQEPSCYPAPATVDLVCEAMAEFVARLHMNLERSARPTNAGVRASRSQLPPLRVENCCRERQQDMEIARCVARPRARENYVEVWLATNVHRPRKSSATGLERSSSAHSCNLCIRVAGLNRQFGCADERPESVCC